MKTRHSSSGASQTTDGNQTQVRWSKSNHQWKPDTSQVEQVKPPMETSHKSSGASQTTNGNQTQVKWSKSNHQWKPDTSQVEQVKPPMETKHKSTDQVKPLHQAYRHGEMSALTTELYTNWR